MAEIKIEEGALVRVGVKNGRILHRNDLETVMVEFDNGEKKIVPILKLAAQLSPSTASPQTSDTLSTKHLEIATRRMEVITPLSSHRRIPRSVMEVASKALGLHRTTIQRMLADWRESKNLMAFAPPNRPGGRGKSRLLPAVEAIIQTMIKTRWLSKQNISAVELRKIIVHECIDNKLPTPEMKTIYRRLAAIPAELQTRKRRGFSAARDNFKRQLGNMPGANHLLAIVEIDHTQSDVVVVDEDSRRPIGRATITAAVDVYTGMCVALYLSLRAPSADLVGACLFRCIVNKSDWLKSLDLDVDWPIWGYPDILHSDNGTDFRSRSLSTTLMELDIKQEFRPIHTPNYGGHIENLMKRINQELHNLPGTTKSNVEKLGEYNSEKHASISLRGLERILVNMICSEYHKSPLNDGLTPEEHLNLAIKHEKFIPGKFQVLQKSREDRDTLRIRCMPMELVTVQKYGIQLDLLRYSDSVLNIWVGVRNPDREDGKFVVRRDPADWSTIYLLEPNSGQYFPIGFQSHENPRFGELEYRDAVADLKRDNREVNEAAIFDKISRRKRIFEEEEEMTKRAKSDRRRAAVSKRKAADLELSTKSKKKPRPEPKQSDSTDRITDTFDSEEF